MFDLRQMVSEHHDFSQEDARRCILVLRSLMLICLPRKWLVFLWVVRTVFFDSVKLQFTQVMIVVEARR